MKKTVFFFLALILGAVNLSALDYYRSNPLGMKIEKILPFRADDFDYTLTVEKEGDTETRKLLSGGQTVKTWIVTVLPGGDLKETEITGEETVVREKKDERLVTETVEVGGELHETRSFLYDETGLSGRIVSGPEGILYTDRFECSQDGRLRSVMREFPDGRTTVTRYSGGPAGLVEEIHLEGKTSTLFRYSGGVVVAQEDRVDNELVSRTEFFPEERRSRTTDIKGGTTSTRHYDEEDRLIHETVEGPTGIQRRDYLWEGDLMVSEILRGGGAVERWDYDYASDGSEVSWTYYRDGTARKKRIFGEGDSYRDIVMRDGRPLLVVYYENHARTRTEYVEDGEGDGEEVR